MPTEPIVIKTFHYMKTFKRRESLPDLFISLLSLLCALFLGPITYYFPDHPIALLAFAPFLWSLSNTKKYLYFFLKILLFYTFVFYGVVHGLVFYIQESLNIPLSVSIVVFLLFGFVHELGFSFVVSLAFQASRFLRLNSASTLILTCFFVLVSRKVVPVLIPMNMATSLMGGDFFLKHIFSIVGVDGAEFLCLVTSLLVCLFLSSKSNKKLSENIMLVTVVSAIVGLFFWLAFLEKNNWEASGVDLKIAFYQPGRVWESENNVNLRSDQELEDLKNLEAVLGKLPHDTDFLILPETYFFSNVNLKTSQIVLLQDTVSRFKVPILSGGRSYYSKTKKQFNNIFLMDENGTIASVYFKRKLMPIGEYKPLRDSFPTISKYLPGTNRFAQGKNSKPFAQINGHKVGLAICYEDVWEDFFREFVRGNSSLVVSVSNDHLFFSSIFAQNHLNVSFAHALSMRLPMVRSTNTGISAILTKDGNILAKTHDRTEELKVSTLRVSKKNLKSFYYRYHEWVFLSFIVLTYFLIVISEKRIRTSWFSNYKSYL